MISSAAVQANLLCLSKGTAQLGTGLGHRRFGSVDAADPEHEAMIHTVPVRQRGRYAGCAQAIDVSLALIAQRVVFGGHHEGRRQTGEIPRLKRRGMGIGCSRR